jgi:hypothetical protein
VNVILIEVERRADGKKYPPGGVLPERERWRAIRLEHQLHCRDRLSIRATVAALAGRGIRRSVGQVHTDLRRYACDVCDPPEPGYAHDAEPAESGPAAPPGWDSADWRGGVAFGR